MSGIIVCFEGIDGAGKHTQTMLLDQKLRDEGIQTSLYSYPEYNSHYGAIIASFLAGKVKVSVAELFLLYLTDMVKDREKIENDLSDGDVVLMDRYFPSTVAYQSAGGFDYTKAKTIEEQLALPMPDLTVYLDIPAEISMARKMKQKEVTDKFEQDKAYLQKVNQVYRELFEEGYRSKKWIRIDGTQKEEEISNSVFETVMEMLEKT